MLLPAELRATILDRYSMVEGRLENVDISTPEGKKKADALLDEFNYIRKMLREDDNVRKS